MPNSSTTGVALSSPEAEAFYVESLLLLKEAGFPFLVAGTYAVRSYTGIIRPTKDMDIFCRAGDYPRILAFFHDRGFATEIEDERWIAKVFQGPHFFDVIFNSTCAVLPITEQWFRESHEADIHGVPVRITPPTELIWSKVFVQDRQKYDGSDVAHVILKQRDNIDWHRLLAYMEAYWEVLLMHVLNFQFIYPSEREAIPRWLFDELLARVKARAVLPPPQTKVCRGRMFSRNDYRIDVMEWGFADVVGEGDRRDG
ncbi:MAG TPA: hypothetical protein VEB64_00125 [Azospirillaceae bacterium]|nr:hypothetical protein [Azospirillaceae bacterium]